MSRLSLAVVSEQGLLDSQQLYQFVLQLSQTQLPGVVMLTQIYTIKGNNSPCQGYSWL